MAGNRLTLRMALARLALAWELLWPAAWPAVGIAGLFLTLALLDVFPILPGWLHLGALIVFVAGFAWACWRAARVYASPGDDAARRRIEIASALAHRPLTAVRDEMASGSRTPESIILWDLHKRRAEEALKNIRVGLPAPGLPRRDPAALRGALLVILVLAGVVAWADPLNRIDRAVSPEFAGTPTQAATLRLWIAPPEYTGRPPIYPSAGASPAAAGAPAVTQTLSVPAGSMLTAQVQNGRGTPRLILSGTDTEFERMDDGVYKAGAKIESGDRLAVTQRGKTLGDWKLEVVPDTPPVVALEAPQETDRAAIKLQFKAQDDYGIAKLGAALKLKPKEGGETSGETLEIDLPLPRLNAKQVADTTYHDLTTHPWAGLEALVLVAAKDGAGQIGQSEVIAFTIPERKFNHPVAKAIIEQRKKLSARPEARLEVMTALAEIASRPGAYDEDIVVFLALVTSRARLGYDATEAAVPPVQKLLWDTALRVEDGKLSIAEREMRELQQRLMEALARNAPDQEIERLMRELQEALNRFLQALAEEMRRLSPDQQAMMPFDPNTKFIEGQDLQRMLQRAQELMQMGARDAARDLLSQLRNILENMQMGRMMNMQRMMQQGQGGEMMRQLQDMIRRQNELLNQSHKFSRDGGKPGDMRSSAEQQRALREALQKLREQLQQMGAGDEAGEALERAERAMAKPRARSMGRGRAMPPGRRARRSTNSNRPGAGCCSR